ncbi:FAS1-like dehydratase domain-containing protein [Pseudomonas saliphila]|uniref:FAS1-like dehydratase domain-containing protein n=1 Tax=Pseudomonas saliphila TaxID=2586906 RepID=UPI00123AFC2D|nr:MaoC family dehydratase N-terminal domain-containing protein [Pseudomonas saliphila]
MAGLQRLKGYRFPELSWSFSEERAAELARVLGASTSSGRLPPTLAFSADMDHGLVDQLFALTGLQAHQLLHGEQAFIYHRPLQPGGVYVSKSTLNEVVEKPRFDLLHKHTCLYEPDGTLVCEMHSVYVAIEQPVPPGAAAVADDSDRLPPIVATVSRQQIQVFANASGDRNAVHLDPAVARRVGHADVFAQGMLGMGLIGSQLSAGELRQFSARFVSPIPLGDPLRIEQGGQSGDWLLLGGGGQVRIRARAALLH